MPGVVGVNPTSSTTFTGSSLTKAPGQIDRCWVDTNLPDQTLWESSSISELLASGLVVAGVSPASPTI